MKMGREKFVPFFFVGGQFGPEPFETRIVRSILFLEHAQPVQVAGLDMGRTVDPPTDPNQDDVRKQDDGQNPADQVIAM
jgi:hypothetical protein